MKNDDEFDVDVGGHCGTCFDGELNIDSGETLIDYGGSCGNCFDGIRQTFETIEIDYGGICGNCTGIKESDNYWKAGRMLDSTIPFDYEYCGEKTDAIYGGIMTFILIVSFLAFLIIIIGIFALSIFTASIFITAFTTYFSRKK